MIIGDELQEIGLQDLALPRADVIDPAVVNLMASAEETLPAGDRIGTDDGTRSKSQRLINCGDLIFPWAFSFRLRTEQER